MWEDWTLTLNLDKNPHYTDVSGLKIYLRQSNVTLIAKLDDNVKLLTVKHKTITPTSFSRIFVILPKKTKEHLLIHL